MVLEGAQVHRPRWTAEQLLSRHLGCAPIGLHLEIPPVTDEEALSFQAGVAARAQGVPLQYLLGSAEFYGREFIVGPGVFCPRPETEVLVEAALSILQDHPSGAGPDQRLTVADIGTGSGAIAITLALECSGVRVLAADRSSLALGFARRNAERLGAAVSFLQGDLLES
ncbi:MAG: peptide chain release factor N(5)-glutamine methyltransferase, partial [Candidatus Omnitrophica bacterium]|nr:peptide chain release factor N(5)-glutamine methyltransferase [Candidatus Omnitrophota bacterium]